MCSEGAAARRIFVALYEKFGAISRDSAVCAVSVSNLLSR